MRKREETIRENQTTRREENKNRKSIQSIIKNKKLLAIMLVLVLAVVAILVATNQEIRKNAMQAFNGDIQNANENEEIQLFDDGSATLTDDSAIVSSVAIVNKVTGTGPFDDNDDPGNDSSATNNIVRSFDTVTYEIEANMAVNNTDHGSEDANKYASFRGGIINVEASIPEENAGTMKWSIDDMAWANGTGVLSEDGLTFTAQYKMSDEIITVPGKQTISLVLKVEGAGNGTQFTSTFKVWMQGNESNKKNTGYEAVEITDEEPVTISAKAGFNIKLVKNDKSQIKTTVNFNDGNGEVNGRMYGYGVILQLYNQDTEKGLKGLEYPKGDITFDIETKLEAVETIDGKQVTTDITNLATPRLWNYKINVGSYTENPAYGNISGRNMHFGSYTGYSDMIMPYGMDRELRPEGVIYNSGNISMKENGNIINTTISDYKLNGIFPKYNDYYDSATSRVYEENIGCFSAGYFQIFVPDNEETLKEDRTYYLTVEDKNIELNTISNQGVTDQVKRDDDSSRIQHYVSKPGQYNRSIDIYTDRGAWINNSFHVNTAGIGRIGKNQNIRIAINISSNSENDVGTEIRSVNKLAKFDGDGLEPILYDNGEKFQSSPDTMIFKTWYVTKKDGSNWIDETERNNANIEDLNMYENLEDIPEGYICIGMYFESQDGMINRGTTLQILIRMKIKDTAEIGKTYGITHDDDYWTVTLDRTTQTATNPNAEYPKPVVSWHNRQYKKTQYDENGQIITGTHGNNAIGNTVLVVGADSSIGVKAIDKDSGEEKTTYDIGRNENVVTLQTTPTLSELDPQIPTNIKGATVRIKQTLPKELTYVPGSSNYGEPIETIENDDGTTTYIWDIYNCNVGETIEPLVIKAEIAPDVTNGTTLNVTSVIEPDRELIGLSSIELRTATTGIQIVNLSNHSLTKETETRIIENNGEITYKVTYQNKTDYPMPDFQLLDILPYNGDGRGTAYNGTYTLKDVKVTQTASGSNVPNDNLSLFTTTDIDARKITPKDEGIGITVEEGGIWQEKEIGQEINEPVTVLALKGEIAPNTKVEMEITLKTNNNRSGDTYSNSVTAQTSKDTEVITSTNTQTQVIKRQISGMIWYDTNENGIKDTDESYANRIEVELLKTDGSKAVDINGNEVPNILTDSNGAYSFTNLPMGEYIVKIYTEDQYRLTTANVGSNMEINSKFEETESGEKQSYTITNLNGIQSPEILEQNVNAGLVVKDAKIIVKYLEEDATAETDEDNNVLKEQDEITTYEKDGEQIKYKLGDSYSTEPAQIENYITLRNSGNTTGTFESAVVEVTYYYTYNKQDITVRKVWEDNNNEAQKRPTSIKVTLKNGNNVAQEVVLSNSNANNSDANIWEATLNHLDIYDTNGQKINYTVDESENEGTLESYNKTIDGYTITNTFTQNTEKTNITVNKVWDDNGNYAGKRPEELTLILKREVKNHSGAEEGETESSYQEVQRVVIDAVENKGSNDNEWTYTFSGISKYDQYNNEINYIVEEIVPDFYTSKVEKVENQEDTENLEFNITNTFNVPDEKISIPVTKVWNDNNNRAGKRPTSVTLVLTGKNKEGTQVGDVKKITLTKANAIDGNAGEGIEENANNTTDTSTTWKGIIENLPKYDDKADEINYELSEENLNSIFYTEANTTINQETKTVTNRFVVPDDKIEIEVNKKWEDNHNDLGRRPENVTLYLTGNNQEYNITLTEANKKAEDESIWSGTIGNLSKYDVNGNEITYTLDERPIANEFYTKTRIDQGTKTVTNTFAIPTESIQIPVTKIWEDNNNNKGYRPKNIVLQIKDKATGIVVSEQLIQGNNTTNDGWNYTFEVPKYNDQGEVVEYEIGERDLNNKFYPSTSTTIDQENRTITNVFTVPDEKVELTVNKVWVDNETQAQRRPATIVINVKAENADNQNPEAVIDTYELNTKAETNHTFTNLSRYNDEGDEIKYTVEEQEKTLGDLKFYTPSVSQVTNVEGEENKKEATITNTFTRPKDTTKIIVNKIWEDNETQSNRRPDSIILVVKNGDQEVKTQEITKEDMVEGTTNQWSTIIDGLQKYDDNGQEIQYTVEEREKTEGDLKFYEAEESTVTVEDNQATIRNNFVKPNDTTTVTVNKVWNDNNDANGKRPESIIVKVTGNGQTKTQEINATDNAVSGNANSWTYTFTDLQKYDDNGQEIVYTASEEAVNTDDLKFYTNDGITGDMTSGYTITNTFKVPDDTIDLTVNKDWVDNTTQAQRRPGTIVINVKAENADNNNPEEVLSTYELNTATETSYTFTGLKKYNSQGNEIEYTVEEQEKNPGDLHFYTSSVGTVESTDENSKEVTITNTFIKPDDKTEVTVTKVWNDNNNEAEKRPESIMLQLKNGNTIEKDQEVNENNKIEGQAKEEAITKVNANRNPEEQISSDTVEVWQYTFKEVEKYNDNGQEIQYTVGETEVNSNDLQFYNKEINGLTVINTFTQDTTKVNVPVTKIWEDNDIQAQRRPESVIVVLKANGQDNQVYELSEETADIVTKNTWTYTFTDLPKYDEYNNIIEYTVDEKEKYIGDLDFYTSKIEGTTITNTFTRPTDTISIEVNKKWEDQENAYEKRPNAIRLEVKSVGNGTGTETVEKYIDVTKDDNWSARFTNLPKYDENGQEIVYTVDEAEVMENDLFNYEKEIGEVTDKVGEVDVKEATITNTMTKIPGEVVVKYVDINTGDEISHSKTKEGIVGDQFDVTEDVKNVEGYTLVKEPEEKTGTYTTTPQEKIYYYAKDTSVIVKYLELDDTPEETADNPVLAGEITINGYEGQEYTTEQKEINNYTFVEDTKNTSGTMERDPIVVIYYYAPNTTVTVKYLEQDGTPDDNSDNKVLAKEVTINGYVGKDYTTVKEDISGYTWVKDTENTEGTMTKDPIEVIYYYAQNTKVIVKYLEKDNTPNDNSDNKVLANEVTINGYIGKDYTTDKKTISNYTYVEDTGNTSGQMTKDVIEVIYYYAQNTKATVQHIDRETGDILKDETQEGKVGDVFETHAEDFEGYVLVQEPSKPNIVMDKTGTQIVKYYYAHVSAGVIEKHIDNITGELLYSEEHKGNEGDRYSIPSKTFEGYDLVTNKKPNNAEGTMKKDEVIEVEYYYIKKAKVIVKYLEEDNTPEDTTDNLVLAKEETIDGHENDTYETEAKQIKGYSLVETPDNAKGTMTITQNADGSYNVETEVVYYYKKQAGAVIENHIDITTGNTLASERHTGNVGDAYEIPSRTFEGYDLVKVDSEGNNMLPENATGTMTEEEIVVNYYYIKQAKVKVEYIDKLTGEKLDEEEIIGHVGDKYTTEEKEFDGYDLTEKPSNNTGEMTEEGIVVKYYYERKAEVEVKYLEKGTEYEIAPSEIIEGYVGDNYETTIKGIPYYNFVESTNNVIGTMEKDKITVIYYYEKQVFNLKIDKWVSRVNMNGISQRGQNITEKDELYKIEINRKKTNTANIKITYKIRVTNTGEIEGTAKEIVEIIPAGYSYYQEDNTTHWEERNGILATDALKDEIIQPGEYKEVEIVLRWNRGEDNFGQKDNFVLLSEIDNPAEFEDINKEDNHSDSSMLITIVTGLDRNDRIIIMAGATMVLAIILAGNIGLFIAYKEKQK